MALFESYERRIDKINACLAEYGIKDIEEAKKGVLKECRVELLGTSSESIERAEDRELFKQTMEKINQPCVPSDIAYTVEECVAIANKLGYPVIIRPAYTLGGAGGGVPVGGVAGYNNGGDFKNNVNRGKVEADGLFKSINILKLTATVCDLFKELKLIGFDLLSLFNVGFRFFYLLVCILDYI